MDRVYSAQFIMHTEKYVFGIDVGTGSARAGLFDKAGNRLATHTHPIRMWTPFPEHFEQSSADIWAAICSCVRACLAEAKIEAAHIAGISFDATCSLVVMDANGAPLAINTEGDSTRDIVVWMDHRATAEAAEINAGEYDVLRYVGGKISPEMQTPKLLWVKKHLPQTWQDAAQFFDLADWLTWRACGSLSRSLCSLVCKWTYLGHANRFDPDYFRAIGLADVLPKIGDVVQPMGTSLGYLSEEAARELGLTTRCVVGQGMIDAHAGGVGVLGAIWEQSDSTPLEKLESTLALIGGTSNCHMATSRSPHFVPGVWGPYYGAMLPGLWLGEGGQSTAGSAIEYAITAHPAAGRVIAELGGRTIYEVLNEEIARLGDVPTLTKHFHVLPYFLGNRSPHADPQARATFDGVVLDASLQSLALQYLATVQAVAYGTRDILETLNGNGYCIDTIFVTGGGTKNTLWLQEHADATGLTLILPEEAEAVLLGSAILAATAAGVHHDIFGAMKAMSRSGKIIRPRPQWKKYHDAKFEIFQKMYREQLSRRESMNDF